MSLQTNTDNLQTILNTVNALPDLPNSVSQATPTITVSSSGLITASATQNEGLVSAGTKSATKQLSVQAAKTITPNTTSQTAVASGKYTTGAVTVAGDANLTAANIAEGVSIFGITGTHSGGSGGGLENSNVTIIFDWSENYMDPDYPFIVLYNQLSATGEVEVKYIETSLERNNYSSITLNIEAIKNMSICIRETSFNDQFCASSSAIGGYIGQTVVTPPGGGQYTYLMRNLLYCVPTENSATFTLSD